MGLSVQHGARSRLCCLCPITWEMVRRPYIYETRKGTTSRVSHIPGGEWGSGEATAEKGMLTPGMRVER
jgi:hypothetical protein